MLLYIVGESCSLVEMHFFTCRYLCNNSCALCPVAKEPESQVPRGNSELVMCVLALLGLRSPHSEFHTRAGKWLMWFELFNNLSSSVAKCPWLQRKLRQQLCTGLVMALWVFNAWNQHYRCSLANEFLEVLADWLLTYVGFPVPGFPVFWRSLVCLNNWVCLSKGKCALVIGVQEFEGWLVLKMHVWNWKPIWGWEYIVWSCHSKN